MDFVALLGSLKNSILKPVLNLALGSNLIISFLSLNSLVELI